MAGLIPRDYQRALDSQHACTASGLILSLEEVIGRISAEAHAPGGGGTDAVNRHPILRLYAEQLLHLSGGGGGDTESYREAFGACLREAEGGDAPADAPQTEPLSQVA
jgi:hypothetical protein